MALSGSMFQPAACKARRRSGQECAGLAVALGVDGDAEQVVGGGGVERADVDGEGREGTTTGAGDKALAVHGVGVGGVELAAVDGGAHGQGAVPATRATTGSVTVTGRARWSYPYIVVFPLAKIIVCRLPLPS